MTGPLDNELSKPPVTIEPDSIAENRPGVLWKFVVILCSLAASCIAGYLFYTWWNSAGGPIGCGRGSRCEEVLTSRWSKVLNLPVSLPASLVYIAMAVTTLTIPKNAGAAGKHWFVLTVLASAAICAISWFVVVQVFLINSICPWCMADHALGGLAAVTILVMASKRFAGNSRILPALATGAALTLMLIVLQVVFEPAGSSILRADHEGKMVGEGDDRQLVMLDGKLEIKLTETPTIGDLESPYKLLKMFDYCCPHCRSAHGFLMEIMDQYPGKFVLFKLPMPLNTKCNPHWEDTDERFAESCELAKLALAVWLYHPDKYPEFDTWLFEPEQPRKLSDAIAHAETFAPDAPDNVSDPRIDEIIQRSTSAFENADLETLPVIMSPDFSTIVGRPGSKQELLDIFESELALDAADNQENE